MAKTPAERQRDYRDRDPERSRSAWRRYSMSERGTVTVLLNYARDRAKRTGVAFDIDADWLAGKLAGGVCELTGLKIERVAPGNYRTHPFAPSLDRIVPALGYTKDNVRLVCFAVNRARSDWGDEVLMTIARALVKHVTA